MGAVLLTFGVATLVGNKFGGFLGDRIGVSWSLVGSMSVHAVALILISLFAGATIITVILLELYNQSLRDHTNEGIKAIREKTTNAPAN